MGSGVRRVKLRLPEVAFLFLLGAVASLVGDHSHVVTGTTEYSTDAVPFVWSSPIWFPLLVAVATISIAEFRLHLPAPRTSVTARQGLAGRRRRGGHLHRHRTGAQRAAGAVDRADRRARGDHVVRARRRPRRTVRCARRDRRADRRSVLARRCVQIRRRLRPCSAWRRGCPLYFAFGVVVALLAEIAAKNRQPSLRSSRPGISAQR